MITIYMLLIMLAIVYGSIFLGAVLYHRSQMKKLTRKPVLDRHVSEMIDEAYEEMKLKLNIR